MTPKDLKNSILQLAIQGKLVEQRAEEGTAEELYQEIQKEKAVLIKAGKIKKQKPLPEIKEEEKPFGIPEGWKWVRFDSIISLLSGADLSSTKYNAASIGIPYITGASNFENGRLIINRWTNQPNNIAHKGDLLLTCKGTVGKTSVLQEDEVHIARQIMAITVICADTNYVQYFIQNQVEYLKSKAKSMIPGIERNNVLNLSFPLPPLAEQQRIVAKIEELLPLVERYEAAYNKLETLNKRFPDDLKKSILQLAIQGKLIEQRPEEGTAEALYQQIQKEKAAQIKAGKIKKQKPLPEIREEEKPFDIPDGWKWCRIGSIFSLQAGKNKTAKDIFDEKSKNHPYQCFGGNGIRGYVDESNWAGHFSIIGRQGALCGNINLAKGNFYATEHAVVVQHFNVTDVLWSAYFLTALNLNQYATATAQPGLAVANINQVLIPLPPLAEQQRIVAKIEELLPLCEQLR